MAAKMHSRTTQGMCVQNSIGFSVRMRALEAAHILYPAVVASMLSKHTSLPLPIFASFNNNNNKVPNLVTICTIACNLERKSARM